MEEAQQTIKQQEKNKASQKVYYLRRFILFPCYTNSFGMSRMSFVFSTKYYPYQCHIYLKGGQSVLKTGEGRENAGRMVRLKRYTF